MQKVKFKSAGIIIDPKKGLLFCIGEERDIATGKKLLLTPGGTVSTIEVEDFNDKLNIESEKPDQRVMDQRLADELNEELALMPEMYSAHKAFIAQSFAATDPDIKLIMDCYIISLNSNGVLRPNYIEGNEDHDVFEAVWVSINDIISVGQGFELKPTAELVVINKDGIEKALIVQESSEYLLTAISKEVIIPKLMRRGLFN